MEVIAVNSGNYNTKAVSKEHKVIFRTKIQENIDATKYIFLDGVKYEIGEGEIDVDNLKSDSLTHKLCTLYATSILHTAYDVVLVVCLPVNQYKNREIREAYKKSLIGTHYVVVNGRPDTINVVDVIVYMEGAAALLNYQEAFKSNIVTVIDIGGYNVNVSQYDKLHLIHGTEDDFDLGIYNIKSRITHDLNKNFNIHLKEHELNYILRNPTEKQSEIIRTHYRSFMSRLRNELKQRGYNLSLNNLFFTGGGSIDLQDELIKQFNNCCIGDVFDTAKGLYNLGVSKCSSV